MSYTIRPGIALTGEVRRIAEAQYDKAIQILRDQPKGRDQAIHDARKRFKRLRGLFRLVRDAAPEFCAREDARIRDMARTLSAVRDATALVEALDHLSQDCAGAEGSHAVLILARDRLAARRDRIATGESDLDGQITAAIRTCETGMDALSNLVLPDNQKPAINVLARGAAKNYARAKKAFLQAGKTGEPDDWHDLRKRIKYHWMHMQLLRAAWPGVMDMRAELADRAAEALGDDHDLAVLADLITTGPSILGDAGEIQILRDCMDARSRRLQEQVRGTLRHLLEDDSKTVRSRIAALYKAAAR